jgi:hypothetical protein
MMCNHNDELEDELANLGCVNDALVADIAELRARVSEIEVRYDNVTILLKEKCAELAAIKPDWENAPEWASGAVAKWYWSSGRAGDKFETAKHTVLYRPEATE